jgi:hypothetical protein
MNWLTYNPHFFLALISLSVYFQKGLVSRFISNITFLHYCNICSLQETQILSFVFEKLKKEL